ncbi:MAG: DsrE family protein [Desulfomicrobium escambiense]|nr:DsrE family protein [Desulfomicrobium escambiense]
MDTEAACRLKVVMHLDWDQMDVLEMGIGNIRNLLKDVPADRADVRFVANGKAVALFRKDRSGEHQAGIRELGAQGVRFCLCRNALAKQSLAAADLVEGLRDHPGRDRRAHPRLQQGGFAYVKPLTRAVLRSSRLSPQAPEGHEAAGHAGRPGRNAADRVDG